MRPDDGVAVLLAAGSSQRFGTDKRLADLDGQPMILRTLEIYLGQVQSVCVVLRPSDPIHEVLPPAIRVIEASDAHLGMGHSLAAAANHLKRVNWILVGLADMPWISPCTIGQIARRICREENAIVRPTFRERTGHPVAFTANYLDELRLLTGDIGAREVVNRNHERVIDLCVTDEAILRDVDTPEQIRS